MPAPIRPCRGIGRILGAAFGESQPNIGNLVEERVREQFQNWQAPISVIDVRQALTKALTDLGTQVSPEEFEDMAQGVFEGIQVMDKPVPTAQPKAPQPNVGKIGQPPVPGRGY